MGIDSLEIARRVEAFLHGDSTPCVLANPRGNESARLEAEAFVLSQPKLEHHIILATSGTTAAANEVRWVCLSRRALEASAAALNEHFSITESDVWLNPLPLFHVGGFGIAMRMHLAQGHMEVLSPWTVSDRLSANDFTAVSLVPTQLFDLVRAKVAAPSSLRFALVGGAALQPELRAAACELGWPVIASYGMSECGSTIALGHDVLRPLPHVSWAIDSVLRLRSEALLSFTFCTGHGSNELLDPKENGWFPTSDRAEDLGDGAFRILGRVGATVKVLGENVDLFRLTSIAEQLERTAVIAPVSDPRAGHRLLLCFEGPSSKERHLLEQFNARVMPFERVARAMALPKIPRTELGKPKIFELGKHCETFAAQE